MAIELLAWFTVGSPNYPAGVLTQNLVFLTLDLYTAYACLTAKSAKGNYTFRVIGILFIVLAIACAWQEVCLT